VIKASDRRWPMAAMSGLRVDVTEAKPCKDAAEAASKAKTKFYGGLATNRASPLTASIGGGPLSRNARMTIRIPKRLLKGMKPAISALPKPNDCGRDVNDQLST